MKLFKRQKSTAQSVIPEEIQAYSQAEHREKMGVAVLVGFISLIITLLVFFGMFIGGRWLYRKIAGNSGNNNTTTVVDKKNATDVTEQNVEAGQKNTNSGSNVSDQENATVQTQNTQTQASTSAAATSVPSSSTLPQTGPDIDL